MLRNRSISNLIALSVILIGLIAGLLYGFSHSQAESVPVKAFTSASKVTDQKTQEQRSEAYGKLPLSFVENKGQADARVKFMSGGGGYSLFLTSNEAVLVLTRTKERQSAGSKEAEDIKTTFLQQPATEQHVLRMALVGANKNPQVTGSEELPGKVNFLRGNDSSRWLTNLPTFAKVVYEEIYPGINLVYYGNQRRLEYDFVVSPGADPRAIKLKLAGADHLKISNSGDLIIDIAGEAITLHKPFIYQATENGGRQEVNGRYVINGNGQVIFDLKQYDAGKPLVIDPILIYSTEIGSGGHDYAYGIAVDASGSAYITGTTDAYGFPTTAGSLQPTSALFYDAFITKLNAEGTALVYSTYLGGDNVNSASGIAVDSSGNAYVTGWTDSSNFPTVNAARGSNGNLLKSVDAGGHWVGQSIASPGTQINTLVVDPSAPNTIYAGVGINNLNSGGIYKSIDGGNSWSALNTGLTNAGCSIIVIDPSTPSTIYAVLGTSNFTGSGIYKSTDSGNSWTSINSGLNSLGVSALAIDPKNPSTLYAGLSSSGLYKSTNGGASWSSSSNGINYGGFYSIVVDPVTPTTVYASAGGGGVFKTTDGGATWSQFNAGLTNTTVRALAIDPTSTSTLYAGTAGGGVFKSNNGGSNWAAFSTGLPANTLVTSLRLNPVVSTTVYIGTANGRIYETTDGGNSWSKLYETLTSISINALAINSSASPTIFAAAFAGSSLNDYEAFVSKLNPQGSALVYSTYLGGNGNDYGNAIAVDSGGNAYVTGRTASSSFMLANAFQSTLKGTENAFVAKFDPAGALAYSTYLGGSGMDSGYGIAVDSSGNAYLTGTTSSADFPVMNPIPGTTGGVFVTKVNQSGTGLVYSTRLGNGIGHGIAVDTTGNAYVTGNTTGGFPTTAGAFQTAYQGGALGDAFATKINPTGSSLVYSTYLGGTNSDIGYGIALDDTDNAYVTGGTDSSDYPLVPGALRTMSPLYKSTDGADNWSNDNYGLIGSTVTSLAIDPKNPAIVYAGTANGFFKSTNGGHTWSGSNNGLPQATVLNIVIDPLTPATIYINAGNIYKSVNGGNSWSAVGSGLNNIIECLAIDPSNTSILYAGTYATGIYKSTNGGGSWTQINNGLTGTAVRAIVVDPTNSSVVYAGSEFSNGGLFKSTDGGASWSAAQSGLSGSVLHLAIDPTNTSVIYASGGSGAFKSSNGAATWSQMQIIRSIPAGGISVSAGSIALDPINTSTIYLVASIGNGNGIYKSVDGGNSWSIVGKGLRYPWPGPLVINPLSPSTLYTGINAFSTDQEVFVTKLSSSGGALTYSTLLGGGAASGTAVDAVGHVYITGATGAPDFMLTPDSYQPFNRGYNDVFVAKLGMSYVISGHVTDGNGAPVSGVEVTLNGSQLSSVFTESDGSYQFSQLPEGGSFTVSAAKAHYSFTPPNQTFNNLNSNQILNFTAASTSAPFYTISGRITDGSNGLGGVKVTLGGSQVGLTNTDSNGNYSFTVPGGGNYTIMPSVLGFALNLGNQSFNSLSANQTADFTGVRQSFVVTNTNDHGAGSLQQAILDANATPGPDTIVFNIPGSGVQTIATRVMLPDITDPVVIDATTQPGFVGSPLVEVNGSNATGGNGNGLTISAGNCTVRGLIIDSFSNAGISISNGGNNVIQGNYIGLDPSGTIRRGNYVGLAINASSNNLIGGTTTGARNVISANSFGGISLTGSSNQIQGNFIGTNAAGTVALGNGISGIEIYSVSGATSTNNLIGGTTPGARNLISGNQKGIHLTTSGNTVQGNFIGTDVNGTAKVGNGVGIDASVPNTLIGGTVPEARNIISGNTGDGVDFGGQGSKLQGNFIGTDVTGTVALGNGGNGVVTGTNSLVGGTVPEARNVISGNGTNGGSSNLSIGYNNSGSGATVQGNFIGTDLTGTIALNNPSYGIFLQSSNNIIGGATPGARNIISGNLEGILIFGANNIIQGNYIGTNLTGNLALSNTFSGIEINNSSGNTIGGSINEAGNLIAFNKGNGVSVVYTSTGNTIRHNSIFSNTGLGIDLNNDGVTPNDLGDADTGANNLQNFPVLTSVTSDSNSTTIQGTLNSIANAQFVLEFFSNSTPDASDFGEGQNFIGTTTITTDSGGNASFNLTFPASTQGQLISATATDPTGNTSEFSSCIASGVAGKLQFNVNAVRVNENAGTATISVARTLGTTGTVTIDYATSDGTATAGSDYVATAGTLTFAPSEAIKTFSVPIIDDSLNEFAETINLTLSNPTGGAMLGSQNTAVLTIADNDPLPGLSISDASITEWDAGTHPLVFRVSLSTASGKPVTVSYATANNTALAGSDYQPTSGTITFNPGETVKTLSVLINGDTVDEPDETFFVNLTGRSNATIARGQGIGTILNDDSPGTPKFQFAVDSYSVNEGDGRATVTVNRSGDTSSSATVDYATSDTAGLTPCNVFNGVASARCDYATTIGTLQFAAGETSKTILIPIVDDAYAEGNETLSISLNNPSRASLGSVFSATITIMDNDATTGANPVDSVPFFVRQHYIDFLDREPDQAGNAGWQNVLNNCGGTVAPPCDRIEVSSDFFRSEEFQTRGYFIYRFYSAVGRVPHYAEFMPDFAKVSGFLSADQLEANKVAFVTDFMARSDFQTKYGSITDPTAYVNALLNTFGLPNHPTKQVWIDSLTNGSMTKAQVLRQTVESAEVYQKYYNEGFVIMQYFGYLRRDADISYLQWIQTMNSTNGDYRTMVNGFLNSAEYRQRFGP